MTVARVSQFLAKPGNPSLFTAMFATSQPTGGLTYEQAVREGVSQQAPARLALPAAPVADAVSEMWARILIGTRMRIVLDESPPGV